MIARVGEIGFPLEANGLYASSIGCIGDPHCNYAVTPTKTKLATIIERLVNQFGDQVGGLKVNLDGCPHACAQHWTGDIGLQGTTGRGPEGEPLEAFDIILRGGLGKDAAIGKPILRRVPSPRVEDYVSRLFAGYLEQRAARRNVLAILRPHARRRSDFARAMGTLRRRCRRLNQAIAPQRSYWLTDLRVTMEAKSRTII